MRGYRLGASSENNWSLKSDPEDNDGQTLLFSYPSAFEISSNLYLRREVKIELGARSDNWPAVKRPIGPYLAEVFPKLFPKASYELNILQPERTFWEKATLLHEENQRPPEKKRNARMARHFYDLWAMIQAGIGASAAEDVELFERVVEHRQFFFPYSWTDNTTMAQGSLNIVPANEKLTQWKTDYKAMRESMFFEAPPSFDQIVKIIKQFEVIFNGQTQKHS